MNKQIIFAGLRARPVRTAVSMLAVAIEVTLILVIAGLATGMVGDNAKRIAGVGADIMIQPPGSSVIIILNSVMSQKMGRKLAEIPGVRDVSGTLVQVNSEGGLEQVWGIDPASFDAVSGGFRYIQGSVFSAPNEVVVDDWYAASKHVAVGDRVEVLNQVMRITGIVAHGKGARIFMSLPAAQEMSGQADKVSVFFLKLSEPGTYDAVEARLKEVLPKYRIVNLPEYVSIMTPDSLPGLREFLRVVVLIAVCIGVMVIFLSMYTAITERTREIGILRALGASKGLIVALVIKESIVLCAVGASVGLALSAVVGRGVTMAFPTLAVEFTPAWIATAVILAVLSGVIGALYPSYRAARQDPIEALAYE